MGWRLAKSLVQLRREVNRQYADRPISADGSIGDEAHSSRKSDHNPDENDVVRAVDITEWNIDGKEMNDALGDFLLRSRDPRIKYVISDGQMFSSYPTARYPAWAWRPYTGSNGHFKHIHISVQGAIDSERPWGFAAPPVQNLKPVGYTTPVGVPVNLFDALPELKLGSKGQHVRNLQGLLMAQGYPMDADDVDGDFGDQTKAYVKRLQGRHGLTADGIVGPKTWKAALNL